ncbi:cobalt-zinc-cadmium resistance protein CzcA [Aquipluma nitroreducens]|uniref:Cobalt-zinc-cadmium resistance protein CzcA n=1 Tax=Aquipluma nitroreducens TaxID=2010828 RepID=A0A5K7S9E4_9BACT|nr:efflux RND transporter permease subunit [Aquipluma nitroreducens]BBE18182.1 cobalt-zinc-cadmium resistance protein CzcA [Aquipluma nitroreducens]
MKNFFVSHKNPVAVVLFIILAAGIFSYTKMQSSLFPEVTFPKIKVIADNGLQPVGKMMITVTKPLENAIKRVPGLKNIRSITSRGSCEISAFMGWKEDIDLCKQQVESSINQIKDELPPGTNISVEKMNPSILPVIGYVIKGKGRSRIEINQIANYTVKPYLSQVPGVSEIRVIGGKTKEFHVELQPQKMSALSVTPAMITTALSESNFISSNGYLNDYNRMYLTVTDANVKNLEELQNLVISNNGKRVLHLQDIANMVIAEQTEYVRVNANGENALLIAVVKQPNANLIDITTGVEKRIAELNKTVLPRGVNISSYYVQADFVNESIRSVSDSLWIGLLLAIVVCVIFLRSAKSSAVILITIPLTISLTILTLYVLGYNFNIMTLGAIAASIGLIIDDAIVVVEQIHRTHEEHPETPTKELLSKSVNYLLPAMIGSSISTIVIFFPFILLSGVAGAYFKILANTMMITLICSFLVTWIGLPVIYLLLSGKRKSVDTEIAIHERKSGKWISFFILRPVISFAFVLALIASVYYISSRLETGFLPEMDEGSIVLDYTSPPGTSLQETDRMLRQVEKLFPSVPEIETYSRRTGTQMGFFITEPNYGDYLIQLRKDRKRSTEEVIDEIRKKVESTQPALQIDFGQVIGDMLGDLMASTQPIEIKIYGDNVNVLQDLARKVAEITENVKGTADVFDGITIAGPSINIEPNNQKLAQFGITPADFQAQLQTQLEGSVIGNIFEKEQQTAIRMIYPDAINTTIDRMKNGTIFLPNGKLQPLVKLAKITPEPGSAEIERENLQSMIPVTARLNNRDLGSVMTELQQEIKSKVNLPQGYHISYGGAYQEQQQSFSELLIILLSAVLLVFTVMIFMFKDIKVALLIIAISILGISGSMIALFITNTPLNVGSYTGIIMIIGIIGENAIFTFLQFHQTLETNTPDEAVVYAISTRLRPKLMTAIGAIIALSPIALGIGTGAQLHQPLAIAVIGGFVIALPLLLIVYPSMLRLLFKNSIAKS